MDKTILKFFDHKICRACGQSFIGENVVCTSCLTEFQQLKSDLCQSEYSAYLKSCKYCGRPFIGGYISTRGTSNFFQPTKSKYCKGIDSEGTHFCQCQYCGGTIKDKSTCNGNWPNKVGCSRKCTSSIKILKIQDTSRQRFGTDFPAQSHIVQKKMKQTCLERYGVESYLQKGSTRDIADAKMREKYNVESNISQNPEIRHKITETLERNHGGYTWASPELAEKCKQTSLKRYGTLYPTQSNMIKMKTRQTNQIRYGVDNVMQSQEAKDSMQRNSRLKYGTNWPAQVPEIIEKRRQKIIQNHANTIENPIHRQNYLEFCEDKERFVTTHFDSKPTIRQLSESLGGLDESTIYFHLGPEVGSRLLSRAYSYMEMEIVNYILSLDPNIIISEDDRQVIKPKEIDIYLPEYKIGIECNPTCTHNSSRTFRDFNEDPTPISYHLQKTNMCEQNEIFLLHVFGYEWSNHPEIIKSMIANLLGKSKYKYYARNLYVKTISHQECVDFLNQNHRQGATNAKIRLGLFTSNNQLVSVMTFNKMRMSMGAKESDTPNTWELSRFCSLLNTSVVGGASKLFKYFLRNYQYDKIVSFSDRAHTRGTLYETLGFHKINVSRPNYVWVEYNTDMYFNRVSCQKRNLPRLFNESDLDIKDQTEEMIMMSHGFVQVYDSGTIRWEYT